MNILYKLFRQDSDSREGVILTTSFLGILVNVLVSGTKITIGTLVSSIAIVSEGINNATDCATSLLAAVGTKLAQKKPTKKHPFGFGRLEYLTSLTIAILIMFTGSQILEESIRRVFKPGDLKVSVLSLVLVAVSALVKLWLGLHTMRIGRKVGSSALVAVGIESRNDSIFSCLTIISSLAFLCFGFSALDAYAGIIISSLILKAGFDVLRDTVGTILGRPADKELADKLYVMIRGTEGVINAADMMLHNYGPDRYSGSVNIEVEHSKSVGEVYEIIHKLQLEIMHSLGVTMVFGIYAVDCVNPEHRKLRESITRFIQEHEHVQSFHALYLPKDTRRIYCDLVVDYDLKDWDKLRSEFEALIQREYPGYELELVMENEYV